MNRAANLGNVLTETARRYGADTGFVHGDERLGWRALERSANALGAALMRLGVGRGDRVAVHVPNGRALFESMYAVMRTGGVYTPVNPRAASPEIVQMIGLCDAKALIVSDDKLAEAADAAVRAPGGLDVIVVGSASPPAGAAGRWHSWDALVRAHADAETVSVPVDRDDICWHSFTSGTTGVPKGGLNSHGGIAHSILHRLAEVTPGLGPHDRLLAVAWIGHGTGTMTTASTMVGSPTIVPEGESFDPGLCWDLIERHAITTMFTVPTILMRLLRHEKAARADRSRLAHVVVTGAAISAADLDFAVGMLGEGLVQYYGAVEAVGAGTVVRPKHEPAPAGAARTIGRARIGSELLIAGEDMRPCAEGEVGEICLGGPGVFRGYYKDPAATAAVFRDGWYLTGDLGYRDATGRVFLAGRKKEMFKSGGLQVYPNEIQDHLAAHDAVEEAHVLNLPDSDLGEIGVAAVALKPGAAITEQALIDHLGARIARYKLPRRIFILDSLPRNPNGKVPKALIKDSLLSRGLIREGEDVARRAETGAKAEGKHLHG